MVTDEHPGYDARAHWCGDTHYVQVGEQDPHDATLTVAGSEEVTYWRVDAPAPRPNLRRVRAWAEWTHAAGRIVTLLAVFALGFALGVYAESAVWR